MIIIVIPCYNEEAILEKNINQTLEAIKDIPRDIKIVISDNNSKDKTAEIGKRLAEKNNNVEYVFVEEAGKGAAIMEAWKRHDADIYGFMDADLATDLSALPLALDGFENFDAAIGSRRIAGADVKRELHRKISSAMLNLFVRFFLKTNIKDTPCGFKLFKRSLVEKIVPQVKDRKWVFDTELLILAERVGFKIKEIPVKWEEKGERGSRVNIYPTIREYLKKIWEIRGRIE